MMTSSMSYADITFNDPSRVKRFLQRRRLDDALRTVRTNLTPETTVIDLGGGDGNLIRRVLSIAPLAKAVCYEPAESLRSQAEETLREFSSARVVSAVQEDDAYDLVFCCEVFEHLPGAQIENLISTIASQLTPSGTAIIGVPNEIFLMGLLKGIFRMARRYGEYDAVPGRVFRAAMGRPEHPRWERDLDGLPYVYEHIGFDYRSLRASLQTKLTVNTVYGSPFPFLPSVLNSEVYFVCRRPGEGDQT